MSKSASTFKVFIRIVFLFAYGAFLWASLHHIAFFFHSFEQDSNNWVGSYALAISIDVTALVLTIGVMFFRKGMALHSLVFVWIFIFALTGFSWLVNWEYAVQFQGTGLNKASGLQQLNPVFASAFAFLNLAYSVIAEFFNDKPKTLQELQDELTQLQSMKEVQSQLKEAKKGTGLIATLTEKAKEVQQAKQDIFGQKLTESSTESSQEVLQKTERTSEELDPEVLESLPELLTEDSENLEESSQEPIVNFALPDKLEMTLAFIEKYPECIGSWDATLDQKLADHLGLIRPASARFWRIKAEMYLEEMRQRNADTDPELSAMPQGENHRRHVMTFDEASEHTGYSVSYLKGQLSKGEIQQSKNGKLLVSSLKIKNSNTGKIPALKRA